jgi:hypothetical protein
MARDPTMKKVDWMFCDCRRLSSRGVYGEGPSSVAEQVRSYTSRKDRRKDEPNEAPQSSFLGQYVMSVARVLLKRRDRSASLRPDYERRIRTSLRKSTSTRHPRRRSAPPWRWSRWRTLRGRSG